MSTLKKMWKAYIRELKRFLKDVSDEELNQIRVSVMTEIERRTSIDKKQVSPTEAH